MKAVSVYDYTNYRQFLQDKFVELKKSNPHFSYRFFNQRAGLKSSGFLKLVMDNKRNLANDGIQKVVKGLKLDAQERKFFEALVKFNQATTTEDKDYYFRETCQYQTNARIKKLTEAQYHLFAKWYYVAILELLRLDSERVKNIQWLHEVIQPSVQLPRLEEAIAELKLLRLISQDKKGNLRAKEMMLSTADEVRSLQIANFHLQMSQIGMQSIRRDPGKVREFSSLTVAISEQDFVQLKKALREFRRRLHTITEHTKKDPKKVVAHVNLQLFRLNRGT